MGLVSEAKDAFGESSRSRAVAVGNRPPTTGKKKTGQAITAWPVSGGDSLGTVANRVATVPSFSSAVSNC